MRALGYIEARLRARRVTSAAPACPVRDTALIVRLDALGLLAVAVSDCKGCGPPKGWHHHVGCTRGVQAHPSPGYRHRAGPACRRSRDRPAGATRGRQVDGPARTRPPIRWE